MRRASPLLETLRAAAQRANTFGLGYVPAALVLDALAELDAARDSNTRRVHVDVAEIRATLDSFHNGTAHPQQYAIAIAALRRIVARCV